MAAKRGQLILAVLVVVLGLPFVASSTLLLNGPQHGQMIEPPLPTPITGAWTLLVPRGAQCNDACRHAHAVAQVVHRALGSTSRVAGPAECKAKEWRAACAAVLTAVGENAALVIVDPMGNAMMRYGPGVKPRDLLKDVRRLEKASRSWWTDGDQ